MNIHEFQAKQILKSYGVAIQEGIVADTPEGAVQAAKDIQAQTGSSWVVLKAQIHAGGRGKGKIVGSEQRGVAIAKNLDDVSNIAKNLLGAGIRLGISSRGMGSVRNIGEGKVEVQDDFEIVCWDLVSNPSTQGAFMNNLNESVGTQKVNKFDKVNTLIGDIISVM